jgi:hypothetical protein
LLQSELLTGEPNYFGCGCSIIQLLPRRNDIWFERLKRTVEKGFDEMMQVNVAHATSRTLEDYLRRIRFVNYEKNYVNVLTQATVILDTFPYGGNIYFSNVRAVCVIDRTGCLTTHDALANSIPMVTLPLEHVRGRYTYAMYNQMGIGDLIASNVWEYVTVVLRLLNDRGYRDTKSAEIEAAYYNRYNKNDAVAREWLQFIRTLFLFG